MRVFNLTEKALVYRRRTLPPNGGSFDFLDLRIVPLRDQKLAIGPNAVLAFGNLPDWWLMNRQQKLADQKKAQDAAAALVAQPSKMAAEPSKKMEAKAEAPAPKDAKDKK
jgi:hypothetical protein